MICLIFCLYWVRKHKIIDSTQLSCNPSFPSFCLPSCSSPGECSADFPQRASAIGCRLESHQCWQTERRILRQVLISLIYQPKILLFHSVGKYFHRGHIDQDSLASSEQVLKSTHSGKKHLKRKCVSLIYLSNCCTVAFSRKIVTYVCIELL